MRHKESETGRINASDAHTILGRESRFVGKLMFEGAVRIDGHFEGEIVTEGLLLVAAGATVHGEFRVGTVVVHGTVDGTIHAATSVEIRSPAHVKGQIFTPNLIVEKGVRFDGTCHMSASEAEAPLELPLRRAEAS